MKPKDAKAPAFQFYVKEYLTDEAVVLMSLEEQGAYVRLLCQHWLEGSIPADTTAQARICGIAATRMKKLWPAIASKFGPNGTPGRLVNARMADARERDQEWRLRQSQGGKFGAQKRWSGDRSPVGNPQPDLMADPMGSDSSASASASASALPDEQITEKEKPPVGGPKKATEGFKKRGTQLPADWQPTEKHQRLAAKLRVDCDLETEKFRDYWLSEGKVKADWDAAFRNWLRKAQEIQNRNGHKPPAGSPAAEFTNKSEQQHYAEQRDPRRRSEPEPIGGAWRPRIKGEAK